VAWTASGIWHPAFGFFVFSFLLFPDGRLPSGRWRPVAWIAAANYLVGGLLGLLWNPLFGEFFPYAEPPFRLPDYFVVGAAFGVFLFINFALLVLSAVSLVLRLRRATGGERQQLKWFVYAVSLFALVFPPSVIVLGDGRLIAFLLPLIPAAAGIAILRHRLFDIDVVINRTLVYGALTVVLAAVYFATVVASQYAFRVLTGQESQLAIVASTLAIAALFVPLRRRVQGFVDRRFYRRKYDAAKTLQSFSTKLRDETDLGALNDELVGVIRRTMQPAHVGFWLRPPPGGGKVGGEGREQ
jgi:MFS family permease